LQIEFGIFDGLFFELEHLFWMYHHGYPQILWIKTQQYEKNKENDFFD